MWYEYSAFYSVADETQGKRTFNQNKESLIRSENLKYSSVNCCIRTKLRPISVLTSDWLREWHVFFHKASENRNRAFLDYQRTKMKIIVAKEIWKQDLKARPITMKLTWKCFMKSRIRTTFYLHLIWSNNFEAMVSRVEPFVDGRAVWKAEGRGGGSCCFNFPKNVFYLIRCYKQSSSQY